MSFHAPPIPRGAAASLGVELSPAMGSLSRRAARMIGDGVLAGQFARYLLVGGAAAVIDFSGFLAALALGAPLVSAAAIGFLIALLFNFAMSARYVFGAAASFRRFALFALFAGFGLTINTSATAAAAFGAGAAPPLAKVIGIAVAFTFNFLVNALVVFRAKQERSSPGDRRGGAGRSASG